MKKIFTFLLMALLALAGFKSWGQETLTVCDGTDFHNQVPIYTGYFDVVGTTSQFIIPSTEIAGLQGGSITKLEFYIVGSPYFSSFNYAGLKCSLKEVSNEVINGIVTSGLSTVYEGLLTYTATTMSVTFTTPFAYTGGHLLVSFEVTSKSGYNECNFYGTNTSYVSSYCNQWVNTPISFIPKTTITYTGGSSCIAPTGLAASNVTATGATISWTGNDAESYDFAYGVASTFDLSNPSTYTLQNNLTTTSVQLSGLTAETEYKCAVKAHCSGDDESAWSSAVAFMPSAFQHLTVNDGTDTYDNVPFYGDGAYYYKTKSQFVIPASYIEDMQGCEITQFKFYVNSSSSYNSNYSSHTWDVYIKEMDDPSGAWWDFYDFGTMTNVYSGSVSIVNNELTITLDEPFQYNNKSLMIGFNQTNTGFYGVTHWLGSNNTTGSAGASRSRAGWENGNKKETKPFLPKTTFTYISVSCPAPTGLTASNITATGATISWTGNGAESYDLAYGVASTFDLSNPSTYAVQNTTATSVQVSGLTAETEYKCAVKARCSDEDESAWSSAVTFMPTAIQHLTINESSSNFNESVPFYGYYADNLTKSQFIIPAASLTAMKGADITAFEFYTTTSGSYIGPANYTFGGSWDVYFSTVNYVTMPTSYEPLDGMDKVYTGNMVISNNKMTLTFSEPYTYEGGNLMICFNQTSTTNWQHTYWKGIATSEHAARAGYGDSHGNYYFLPTTTFTYTPGATRYNVTIDNAITGGSISANPTEATAGTVVNLSATPAFGYEFGAWVEDYEDVTIEDNQFTMPEHDVTISATFNELTQYAINITPNDAATIHATYNDETISKAPEGLVIDLSYDDLQPGYTFDHWNVVYNGKIDVEVIDNQFTMPAADVTVSAVFSELTAHSVTIAAVEGGTISVSANGEPISTGDFVYPGTTLTFGNTPTTSSYQPLFKLDHYVVTEEGSSPQHLGTGVNTYTMPNCNLTVSAVFIPLYFPTLNTNYPGSVSLWAGMDNMNVRQVGGQYLPGVAAGEYVFINAEDIEGYRKTVTWSDSQGQHETIAYSGDSRPCFVMPADNNVTVSVQYAVIQKYNIALDYNTEGGSITVSQSEQVAGGTLVHIYIATTNLHFSFNASALSVTYNEGLSSVEVTTVTEGSHYQFSMPEGNVTVHAEYTEDENYAVSIVKPEGCDFDVSYQYQGHNETTGNVYCGYKVYLENRSTSSGYRFDGWNVTYKDSEENDQPVEVTEQPWQTYFVMPQGPVTITADVTKLEEHNVTIVQTMGGTITVNGHDSGTFKAREDDYITMSYSNLLEGYIFDSWIIKTDSETYQTTNSWFYMLGEDVTVSATFLRPETLTVYGNGGQYDYSGIYPIYTYWGDTQGTTSQFIIPAEELEDMVGGTIKEMKFFISSGGDTGGQIWECRIKEVDYTVLTGIVDVSTLTPVYSGHYLSFANNEWNVTFDTPFAYSGKNLLVSFECTTKGNYKSNSFWGENVEYNASYSSREGVSTFIPKTVFTYLPDPTVVFYDIEIAQVEAGTITASKTRAKADTEIELSMNMNEGYTFSRWIVKDADSQDVTVTDNIFTMPASNVTVTAEYNTLPRYNVTLVPSVGGSITATPSENVLGGTWVKLVATPDHGYRFVSWSGSTEAGGTLFIVDIETSEFTMPASNATVTATFEALPTYEVNYYANGLLVNTLTPYEGDDIDITPCEVPEGVNFYGWATSEIDETPYLTAAPSIITEGTPVDAAKNLYAVFSYSEQIPATGKDGETWVEVTSPTDLSSGDQVIFVEKNNNKVLAARTGEYDGCFRSANISISNNEISSIPSNAVVFEAESTSGSWKFWFDDVQHPGLTTLTDYNGSYLVPMSMNWGGSDLWTIISNGSSVNIQGESGNYIIYNSGDFTVDGSSVYKKCVLFKKYNPFITNTYYMTEVLTDGEVAANTTAKNIIITEGTVTVDNNIVLTMNENGLFRNEHAANFVFEDGAEFIYTGAETVNATFQKDIKGYNSEESIGDGWYFIANPTANTTVNLSGGYSYDLYTFNPAAAAEWQNEQYENNILIPEGNIEISRKTGYLYANSNNHTLRFEGELIPSGEDQTIDLVYYEGGESGREFPGFNLIGNPFSCTAYISGDFEIFKLGDGSDVEISTDYTVAPCEAFFVEATADNKEVTLSTTAPEGKSRIMPIVVNSDRGETLDRAILHLEGTRNSHKFMMNPDRTNISFAKNGERFASVSRGDETEIPMNFTADHKGSYTISFNTENFEEEYLHLIDVVSGDNIDLLVTPSYTFEADADEYASRFRIVFGTTDINDNPATSSEPFVYISNGNLVINNVEGTASMQIVDMLGRIVRTETVCGSYNKPHNLKAGAYVITLDGRAQRIVIE